MSKEANNDLRLKKSEKAIIGQNNRNSVRNKFERV